MFDMNMGPRYVYSNGEYELPSKTFLAVVPANILGWFPIWTFVTAPFYENSFVNLIFAVIAVIVIGKFVSSLKWSNREFSLYVIFVGVLSMITSFVFLTFYARITLSIGLLRVSLNGFMASLAAFAVIAKMEIPENQIQVGLLPIQGKHVPLAYIVISILFSVLTRNPSMFFLPIFGTLYGWFFLRFYLIKDSTIGCQSEDFTFASFFPFAVQPFVNMITTPIHNLMLKTPILTLRGTPTLLPVDKLQSTGFALGTKPTPLSEDAKRRIEVGNKAIDELLNKKEDQVLISIEKMEKSEKLNE